MRLLFHSSVIATLLSFSGTATASAQQAGAEADSSGGIVAQQTRTEEQVGVLRSIDSERLRVAISIMGGYGHDASNADKGFERQGRIGYAIVSFEGRLNSRVSYLLSINPISEISPLPACPESGVFRPNDPQFLYADLYAQGRGPQISCDPQGTRRTDMYRRIAWDMLPQQGGLREAYVNVDLHRRLFMRLGRMGQPVGFIPEEAGSWSANDAPLVQRLNRDAFFTWMTGSRFRALGLDVGASLSVIAGDSDASKDYGYNKLFADGSLDGNSGPGAVGNIRVSHPKFEARLSYRANEMGSKIESLAPSYWAAGKHHDNALVYSGMYRFTSLIRLIGECGRYTVGLKQSSALMVGSNPDPVRKNGCYVTAEAGVRLRPSVVVGASMTREKIDRADSMIRYLSERGLYGVTEGKSDRMQVVRFFVDLNNQVKFGAYHNRVSNPFPWVSGIWPVDGPNAFTGRSLNRWGLVFSLQLR